MQSEAEVGESAVCLGHLVHVLFTFEGAALVVEGIHDFRGQLVAHGLAAMFAGIIDEVFH